MTQHGSLLQTNCENTHTKMITTKEVHSLKLLDYFLL